jgi:hypothetical protein
VTPARLALVSVALVSATLATGCSTFTKNDVAAEVNGHELSVDDFEAILADDTTPDAANEYDGAIVRSELTRWVRVTALVDALATQGVTIDDAARAAATEQAKQEAGESAWNGYSDAMRALQIDVTAALNAIAASDKFVGDGALREAYEKGGATSGIYCLRVMAFTEDTAEASEAAANAVLDQLRGGADFATLANDHPLEPDSEPNGGVLADQSGAECLSGLNAQITGPLGEVAIGEVAGPITLDTNSFLVLQRPFDEVAAAVRTTLGTALAGQHANELTKVIEARVDTRYGTWDSESGSVVTAR